jgi:hypothetical protein
MFRGMVGMWALRRAVRLLPPTTLARFADASRRKESGS